MDIMGFSVREKLGLSNPSQMNLYALVPYLAGKADFLRAFNHCPYTDPHDVESWTAGFEVARVFSLAMKEAELIIDEFNQIQNG